MSLVSPTLPSPGDVANASDISTPINQLATVINGGLDDTNINTISGSKIAAGTVDSAQLKDAGVTGSKVAAGAITLGYAQITSNWSSTAVGDSDVTGLSVSVTVPAGGRRVKVTFGTSQTYTTNAGNYLNNLIVCDSTKIGGLIYRMQNSQTDEKGMTLIASHTPSAGTHTYKVVSNQSSAGTKLVSGTTDQPAYILVEAI